MKNKAIEYIKQIKVCSKGSPMESEPIHIGYCRESENKREKNKD